MTSIKNKIKFLNFTLMTTVFLIVAIANSALASTKTLFNATALKVCYADPFGSPIILVIAEGALNLTYANTNTSYAGKFDSKKDIVVTTDKITLSRVLEFPLFVADLDQNNPNVDLENGGYVYGYSIDINTVTIKGGIDKKTASFKRIDCPK